MLRKAILGVLLWQALGAAAQTYPAREITLVVPYPISGPSDIRGSARMTKSYKIIASNAPPAISDTLSRIVQQALRYDSKHAVVLERHPGGTTVRGARHVARLPADGYTLLLASNATMVLLPHYLPAVGYDPTRDFELVAPLVNMPFVLFMSSGLPVQNLQRLMAYIKMRPGEINYGSSGDGSTGHLAGELLQRAAGLNMVHVGYNGGFEALNALATGQTSLMFAASPLAMPYLTHEQLRVLAVASAKRTPLLPQIQTLHEAGIRNVEVSAWFGMFARNGTSPTVIRWLSERIGEAINEPATRSDLMRLGLEPVRSPLSEFASRIYAEGEQWGPVLRAVRIPGRKT